VRCDFLPQHVIIHPKSVQRFATPKHRLATANRCLISPGFSAARSIGASLESVDIIMVACREFANWITTVTLDYPSRSLRCRTGSKQDIERTVNHEEPESNSETNQIDGAALPLGKMKFTSGVTGIGCHSVNQFHCTKSHTSTSRLKYG
jgi:hypothetical protein